MPPHIIIQLCTGASYYLLGSCKNVIIKFLDISDAIFLARFVAEDSTLDMSNFNVQNADINGDGLTSAADTVYIIRKIAKLI